MAKIDSGGWLALQDGLEVEVIEITVGTKRMCIVDLDLLDGMRGPLKRTGKARGPDKTPRTRRRKDELPPVADPFDEPKVKE